MRYVSIFFRYVAYALSFALLAWTVGFVAYVLQIVQIAQPDQVDTQPTDAIVVLTGGTNRLDEGFQLLSNNFAERLFISGAGSGVTKSDLLLQLKTPIPQAETLLSRVDIGYQASDTSGNAQETAAWMRQHHFTSLRLVTSNYHMLRSIMEFSKAMPEITIIAHPIVPDQVKLHDWWRYPGTAKLLVLEYIKYLAFRLQYFSHP